MPLHSYRLLWIQVRNLLDACESQPSYDVAEKEWKLRWWEGWKKKRSTKCFMLDLLIGIYVAVLLLLIRVNGSCQEILSASFHFLQTWPALRINNQLIRSKRSMQTCPSLQRPAKKIFHRVHPLHMYSKPFLVHQSEERTAATQPGVQLAKVQCESCKFAYQDFWDNACRFSQVTNSTLY